MCETTSESIKDSVMKKISVIIPAYNAERYIERTLNDLICQTYKNLEIIVVDDGSTDRTGMICDEVAEKNPSIVVIHKQNGGVSSARNCGLEMATGDYIGFVDADDRVDSEMYEIMANVAIKNDSDLVACGFVQEFTEEIQIIEHHDSLPEVKNYVGRDQCIQAIECNQESIGTYSWNKIFCRSQIGDLRFPEDMALNEDTFFIYHFMNKAKKANFQKVPLYHYRYVRTSLTKASKVAVYLSSLERIQELIIWSKKQAPECTSKLIQRYLFWNTKACEAMIRNYDQSIYQIIKSNIKQYADRISTLPIRQRLLVSAAGFSWLTYKAVGETNLFVKNMYSVFHEK